MRRVVLIGLAGLLAGSAVASAALQHGATAATPWREDAFATLSDLGLSGVATTRSTREPRAVTAERVTMAYRGFKRRLELLERAAAVDPHSPRRVAFYPFAKSICNDLAESELLFRAISAMQRLADEFRGNIGAQAVSGMNDEMRTWTGRLTSILACTAVIQAKVTPYPAVPDTYWAIESLWNLSEHGFIPTYIHERHRLFSRYQPAEWVLEGYDRVRKVADEPAKQNRGDSARDWVTDIRNLRKMAKQFQVEIAVLGREPQAIQKYLDDLVERAQRAE